MLKKGSVFGAVLLITGSCVGAGMLALPVITGLAGFIPASVLFILAWLFMTSTGLLLLEANLSVGYNLSLISLAEKTLGFYGKVLCWILFVFLFYSLGIAYIAASGDIVRGIAKDLFDIEIAKSLGSFLFTFVFAVAIFFGTRTVDYINRILMLGLVVSYVLLMALAMNHISPQLLLTQHWKGALVALPVLVISFGFHNMIPTLAYYLNGDRARLRATIFLGSSIPLIIYLLFEAVMLGMIPAEEIKNALEQGVGVTSIVRTLVGKSWVSALGDSFALFAIVTSFLTQSLSLVDFLSDGLKMPQTGWRRVLLIALTLIPPFVFAFYNPCVFLEALNMAGAYSAVILFGVMPALMCYILRKRKVGHVSIVPGGTSLLAIILVVACATFVLQLIRQAS